MLKSIVKRLLESTPYEMKLKRLPPPTLESVKVVAAMLLCSKPLPVVVQIGACDGSTGDPLYEFLRTGAFRAVVVEPVESSFQQLEQTYSGIGNVRSVRAAIADQDGWATMYKVRESARSIPLEDARQLASFSKSHILSHNVPESEVEEIRVEALTLETLLRRSGIDAVDLLQVDTEGFDAQVVKMALRLPVPPACINFESSHLSIGSSRELFGLLETHGYRWAHDRMNSLAIHESWASCFAKTPGMGVSREGTSAL